MGDYQAIVVGSGLAGLTAALSLAPQKTLLISKTSSLESGSTPWAQGGVAFPQGAADVPLHIRDTLVSGAGKSLENVVKIFIENAHEALVWLEGLGLFFDHNDAGYLLGKEGAHSIRRILHLGGDATGRILSNFLTHLALAAPHITVWTNTLVCGLDTFAINDRSQVSGLWVLQPQKGLSFVASPAVLFAGGGTGQLFANTTNPPESTGDTMALALRAGLALRDMEMIQFHPTALQVPQEGPRPQLPLLSEALRGEGARLVFQDRGKTKPLPIPHPLKELGPRDIVARSIFQQIQQGYPVLLDAREIPHFADRFPTILEICQKEHLNPGQDLLPVVPAVHYTMGGIPTDDQGQTALHGLWAVGECASSGVHGANRLASNSLLECLVFARRAAKQIKETIGTDSGVAAKTMTNSTLMPWWSDRLPEQALIDQAEKQLQDLMFESAGPVRSQAQIASGLARWVQIKDQWNEQLKKSQTTGIQANYTLQKAVFELENLFLLGKEVLSQALANPISCGAHFRQDSP